MWMLPLYSLRFIASPLSYTFYIVDKQHVDLAWQVGLLVMTVATLNITSTSDVVLRTYAYSYSALYLIYIYLSYRCSLSFSLACHRSEARRVGTECVRQCKSGWEPKHKQK